jgi:hypothetical protein
MHVMKRLYAAAALALLFTALPFAMSMGRASAQEEPGSIAYRVDVSDPDAGQAVITMEIEAASRPLVLEMRDSYGDGLAVDLASHITNESAVDNSGDTLPLSREGNTWKIDEAGDITFTYSANISGYRAGTEYLNSLADSGGPWPYFPLLQGDLAYLPGYAIFLYPRETDNHQFSLEVVMPPQWRQAIPWADQKKRLDDLLNNPIFAGELEVMEQGSLTIALPSASAAASGGGLAEYAEKASSLLSNTQNTLGGPDPGEDNGLLIALLFRGEGDRIIDQYYVPKPFSSSIALPGPSRNELLSDLTIEATARGMVYLSTAMQIDPQDDALWLREGAAWYYQDLVPYQAGIWGAGTFWDHFNRHYQAYRDARGRLSESLEKCGSLASSNADAAAILDCGGASASAALDSDLKSLQPYALDLATVLQNLAELSNAGNPLDNDDILSTLEIMTDRSWSGFFGDYISGSAEIPPSSFSSLNITQPDEAAPPLEELETSTSVTGWIILAIAIIVVFAIPFILEPYTMRPRKPGFLEKKLQEDEEE